MAQGQHLEVKRESGSHQSERQQKRKQHGCHRETAYPSPFGKCNGASESGLFSRHTCKNWQIAGRCPSCAKTRATLLRGVTIIEFEHAAEALTALDRA